MQLTMLLPGCAHCEWEEVTGAWLWRSSVVLLPLLTGLSREHGAAHCVNHGQHVCAVNVTQTYSSKDKIGRAVRHWAPRWNEVAN